MAHAGGRPSKLTPALIAQFVPLLEAVPYWQTAADYLGLPRQTVWAWLRKGERAEHSIYGQFHDVVKKARARTELALAARVRTEPEQWQRFAWMLERAYPEHWGKRLDITLRQEAEYLAAEYGLDRDEVLREVERVLAEVPA